MIRARITHVAIRFDGNVFSLPPPNRHHDVIMHIVETTGAKYAEASGRDPDWDVGFLDANGNFLTRKQAMVSALMFDQIKNMKSIKSGALTSQDLW